MQFMTFCFTDQILELFYFMNPTLLPQYKDIMNDFFARQET